jgi:hypothetical protein
MVIHRHFRVELCILLHGKAFQETCTNLTGPVYVLEGGSWKGSNFNQVGNFGVTSITFLIWDILPLDHQLVVLTRNQFPPLLRMI